MSKTRPPVSLSMSLHCRAKLWLAGHGYAGEKPTSQAQRTFDVGHMAERAMFDGYPAGYVCDEAVGPWWFAESQIRDNSSGVVLTPSEWEVTDRQREVELAGYKGHIDALLRHKTDGTVLLPDMKTASSFGYDKSLTGDMLENPFSRQYVGQLHAYRLGLLAQGQKVDGMLLLYYSKENSRLSFRYLPHMPEIDEEIHERLSWARAEAEPTPDYEWSEGRELPLVCSYCDHKTNCAALRGLGIQMGFKKGRNGTLNPSWTVAA